MKSYLVIITLTILLASQTLADNNRYNFEYTNLDNNKTHLLVDEDTYIFVEFFATWCDSCRLEMEILLDLYTLLPDNLVMKQISISPDTDSISKIEDYRKEFDAQWEFGVDKKDFLAEVFNVEILPTAILFDPNGTQVKIWIGLTKLSKFINDINYEIPNANIPIVEDNNNMASYAVRQLISNPVFIISISIITLAPMVLKIITKYNKKNQ